MATDPMQELSDLVHDVNAKCANLKSAASMLQGKATPQELKFLALMKEQSRYLADKIAAYEASRGGAASK